jgi:predicted enzyme related to lactoylglutathione lyase
MAGKPVHFEIPAQDTDKATDFWGSLFGWQFQAFEGSPTPYLSTQFDDQTGGAIYVPDGESQGIRVYFGVDDISSAGARVRELGGEMGDAMPVPGMGWFSIGKDTGGNEFGLWQNDPSATMPE